MEKSKLNSKVETLPSIGMSRFSSFKDYLPFSREKFRQLSKAGKAPQGIRMGTRLTMYENREIHRFLSSPLNYRLEEK